MYPISKKMGLNVVYICFFASLHFSSSLKFEDISTEVFPVGDNTGIIAAFGHFNADEFTDVLTLQQNGKKLQLLKGSENQPYFETSFNCSFKSGVSGVIPGDYNGDSFLDVLIIMPINDIFHEIQILWGTNDSIDCRSSSIFKTPIHPLIVDFNGDMLPDIITENENYERYVLISSKEKQFTPIPFTNTDQKMTFPHSSGLIDINNDFTPDILIYGDKFIETWLHNGKTYFENNASNIPYPSKASYKWQSTFVDMNLDGTMDLIMPVCYDDKCENSAVLIWNTNSSQWETIIDSFLNPNDKAKWGFFLDLSHNNPLARAALPATLRAGDVDLDGFPDFVTVLQSKRNHTQTQAVIFRNEPCENCYSGRKIRIDWDVPGLKSITKARIATFFDIFEDGILDILISTETNHEWKVVALKNTEIFDSCFLKVIVLSGLCREHCTTESYGVNQPGPMVRYNMTTQSGQPLVSTSIQLSQSAHFPLQLPYSLFGLGQTPNFIDVLTVSVPAAFEEKVHQREWKQIIPNSQIVVIPHPPGEEKKWVKKLFVTPSHLVLLTCIALIGTCIFMSLLVALLHWRERREDKKEKMQDAYRFHFDAM